MRAHLLSLDLGTTFCKAAIYDAGGHLLDAAQAACQTASPRPGWAEQDPDGWLGACGEAVRALDGRLRAQVHAVGLSGRMGTVLYLDGRDRPLHPALLHADSRGAAYRARLLDDGLADTLGISILNTLPRMLWLREHRPEVPRRARRVCGAKEYAGLWLTGCYATDFSNGPGLPDWPALLSDLAGLPAGALPPILHPTTVLGPLRAEAASGLLLPAGIPVVLGASDGACANLGVGASEPGSACLSLSTTGVVRLAATSAPRAGLLANIGGFAWPFEPGCWLWGGIVTMAGAALDWLRALLDRPDLTPEALEREAESVAAGSEGLRFRPYLLGMHSPEYRPQLRGAFEGLSVAHRRPHLVRAVMEGVSYSVRAVVDALRGLGARCEAFALTGGCARSGVWRQIVADVLGADLVYQRGGTGLGAAIIAACGAGLYADVRTAQRAMLAPGERVRPGPAMAEYGEHYAAFREALQLGEGRHDATPG